MESHALNKNAIRLLRDNGYRISNRHGQITLKRSATDQIIGIAIMVFIGAFSLLIIFDSPEIGAIPLVASVLGIFYVLRRINGGSRFEIDTNNRMISHTQMKASFTNIPFRKIKQLKLHSEMVDEYTSADKETNKEHEISIGMTLDSGDEFIPLKFRSDYAEPSDEIDQVFHWLEDSIKEPVQES